MQCIMERAECYKQPILAGSWRALQAKTHTDFCQQQVHKAAPGAGCWCSWHWLWFHHVKESLSSVPSHFTCGPWQLPAGCTVHHSAHQGAREEKRQSKLQLCLSSLPGGSWPSFWQAPSTPLKLNNPREGRWQLSLHHPTGRSGGSRCEPPSRE